MEDAANKLDCWMMTLTTISSTESKEKRILFVLKFLILCKYGNFVMKIEMQFGFSETKLKK